MADTKKEARQLNCSTNQGTNTAVTMMPMLEPAFKIPVAVERSARGYQVEMAFMAAGKLEDSPKPSKARTHLNCPAVVQKVDNTLAMLQIKIPMLKPRLVPIRSMTHPTIKKPKA